MNSGRIEATRSPTSPNSSSSPTTRNSAHDRQSKWESDRNRIPAQRQAPEHDAPEPPADRSTRRTGHDGGSGGWPEDTDEERKGGGAIEPEEHGRRHQAPRRGERQNEEGRGGMGRDASVKRGGHVLKPRLEDHRRYPPRAAGRCGEPPRTASAEARGLGAGGTAAGDRGVRQARGSPSPGGPRPSPCRSPS
jgi:hypothetical protein